MNNKLSNTVNLVGNASQIIIAGSILVELYQRIRARKKGAANKPTTLDAA